MKYALYLLLATASLQAQKPLLSADSLFYPSTDETQNTTASLWLINPGPYPLPLKDVVLFSLYDQVPFRVQSPLSTVLPGDSLEIQIDFQPQHNLYHRMAAVVRTAGGLGHRAIALRGQGVYSRTYYQRTQNLREEALKSALNSLLALSYNSLSYNAARDAMYSSIDNQNGLVECVYTGRSASFSTRSGATANQFNCEHTFPQGFFSQNLPMRSDIHHLFPTDINANSQRGNDPFGTVSNASWTSGGSRSGGGRFEPRDAHKGAAARAMLYFVIRYRDYANHFAGQEVILRQWHRQFSVSQGERDRNQAIYSRQNNRNPFVDYPQLEARISSFVQNSVASPNPSLWFSDDTIFLAQGPIRDTFHLVLYNRGNTPLQCDQFQLSDPNLQLISPSGSPLSLAPGAFEYLKIAFDGSQSAAGQLSFRSSDRGNQIVIPIAQRPLALELSPALTSPPEIFPNPVRQALFLGHGEHIVGLRLWSGTGQVYPLSREDLSVAHLPKGTYTWKCGMEREPVITASW